MSAAITALGGFEFIKFLVNRKRAKRNDEVGDNNSTYSTYVADVKKFMGITSELQSAVTDLRDKLDKKNQHIFSISQVTRENTEKIERLELMKCERAECDNRIPPKKTKQLQTATA